MRAKMRIGFGGVVVAAGMIAMSTGAAAVDDIVFTASGVVSGPIGSLQLLGEVTVAPELVGATCTGRAETANQDSVHPNNDMIITTGTTQAEIPDFESAAFKVTPLSGTVVLGPTVRFEVRIGDTFVSSGGVVVTLDCTAVGPPTTPAPPTTASPDPPTTPAPVTTIGGSGGPAPTTAAPGPTSAGASVSGAGALPETGSSSGPAILAATALIIAGVVMTLLRRRAAT